MTEFASRLELGDFYAEYDGTPLGAGEVTLELSPAFLDLKRDRRSAAQARRVTALTMRATVTLGSPDRALEAILPGTAPALAGLDGALLTGGGELKLHPLQSSRTGYAFPRACWEGAESRNSPLAAARGVLRFLMEPDSGSGVYFTRFSGSLRPDGLAFRTPPSPTAVSRALIQVLSETLDAEPDQTLFRECFAPDGTGSYGLFTENLTVWNAREPRRMLYSLRGRFPLSEKDAVNDALAAAADFLHGHELRLAVPGTVCCRAEKLTFADTVADHGRIMTDNRLYFTLYL